MTRHATTPSDARSGAAAAQARPVPALDAARVLRAARGDRARARLRRAAVGGPHLPRWARPPARADAQDQAHAAHGLRHVDARVHVRRQGVGSGRSCAPRSLARRSASWWRWWSRRGAGAGGRRCSATPFVRRRLMRSRGAPDDERRGQRRGVTGKGRERREGEMRGLCVYRRVARPFLCSVTFERSGSLTSSLSAAATARSPRRLATRCRRATAATEDHARPRRL